jgi:hypothetical protein
MRAMTLQALQFEG